MSEGVWKWRSYSRTILLTPALGLRRVKVGDRFYIAEDDAAGLKVGDEIRLIELYNVKVASIDWKNGARLRITAEVIW